MRGQPHPPADGGAYGSWPTPAVASPNFLHENPEPVVSPRVVRGPLTFQCTGTAMRASTKIISFDTPEELRREVNQQLSRGSLRQPAVPLRRGGPWSCPLALLALRGGQHR